MSVGAVIYGIEKRFELFTLEYRAGERLHPLTDGKLDQFGGDNNRKMMRKQLERHLTAIQSKAFDEHKKLLEDYFTAEKGEETQVDDVLVVSVEL
ncbi:MAG: hypothetical protein ACJATE_002437 [Bacteroidia bacterium]